MHIMHRSGKLRVAFAGHQGVAAGAAAAARRQCCGPAGGAIYIPFASAGSPLAAWCWRTRVWLSSRQSVFTGRARPQSSSAMDKSGCPGYLELADNQAKQQSAAAAPNFAVPCRRRCAPWCAVFPVYSGSTGAEAGARE